MADWLKSHDVQFPAKAGKKWTDKACWLIKSIIAISEEGPTAEAKADAERMLS